MITPPTDSIYKFFAISGLVLIIWGLSFPETKKYELAIDNQQLIERIRGHKDLMLQYEMRGEEINELVTQLGKLEEVNNKTSTVFKQLMEYRKEFHSLNIEVVKETLKNRVDLARNKVMQQALERLTFIAEWSFYVGIFLVFIGFLMWYMRLQRFIDINIKNGTNP